MKQSRRVFLQVLGGATASIVAWGCGAGTVAAPLKAADVAVGQIIPLTNASAFVGRDAGGLYALSAICTHEGCDISANGSVQSGKIVCGCHGAMFDADGNVLRGPAKTALPHIELLVAPDGTISVNAGKTVSATTRV